MVVVPCLCSLKRVKTSFLVFHFFPFWNVMVQYVCKKHLWFGTSYFCCRKCEHWHITSLSLRNWTCVANSYKLYFPVLTRRRLGWESVSGEPHLNVLLRGEIFMALALFGDEKTHEDAIKRFESLLMDKNTPLLSADTKRVRTLVDLGGWSRPLCL